MPKKEIILRSVILSLIFLFLIVPSVSALYWTSYGNDYTPMWFEGTGGFNGRFDLNVSVSDITSGYDIGNENPSYDYDEPLPFYVPYQPLVWAFNDSENYMIIGDESQLEVYNSNLLLVESFSVVNVTSQIDLVDFSGYGNLNEVVGVYRYNDTLLQFKSHRYNVTSANFEETSEYNITTTSNAFVNGVRCGSGECYFTITDSSNTYLYWASISGINNTIVTSFNSSEYPLEPPAWFDIDSDGELEFLLYSMNRFVMVEKSGDIDVYVNATSHQQFTDVKMFQPDLTNDWRYAVYVVDWTGYPLYFYDLHTDYLKVYRADGTILWSDSIMSKNSPTFANGWFSWGRIAISSDYDGDFLNDIYVVGIRNVLGSGSTSIQNVYRVYRGYDGDLLLSGYKITGANNYLGYPYRNPARRSVLVIVDMNGDDVKDFIWKNGATSFSGGRMYIVDGDDLSYIYTNESIKDSYSCIPSDFDFDGFLDILCSGSGGTTLLQSGGINLNSYITSVVYSPSTTLNLGQSLTATINALDNEGNDIYYRSKCSNSLAWSSADLNNVKTCNYASVGTYNMSVGVKDAFHSDYVIFSQDIIVSESVGVCDNDGICEAGQGETSSNCPNDCLEDEFTQTEGGTTIPVDLVNPTNLNEGFLPEIYYGTLGFFSGVLQPMIILVFVIFFALIIITIGGIIKKIATRVSELGG